MTSPQLEDGYTRIANELLEAFGRTRFAGQERQVLDAVLRLTYGFNQKASEISYSRLSALTEIPRTKIVPLVKSLVLKRVLCSTNNGTRKTSTVWINKHYSEWLPSPKKGTSPNNGTKGSPNNGVKVSPNNGTHKRHKEKKDIPTNFLTFSKGFLEYQKSHFPLVIKKITDGAIESGAKIVSELVADGFNFDTEIRPIMQWAVKDEFWKNNVHSLVGLRKRQDPGGLTKFQKILSAYQRDSKRGEDNDPYVNVPWAN